MANGGEDGIRNAIIEALIVAQEAQVRALHQLRKRPQGRLPRRRVGMSQVDMVEEVIASAGKGMHINEIIEWVEKRHGVRLDRESVVSALTKKVARGDRFVRTGKNTFGLKRREA